MATLGDYAAAAQMRDLMSRMVEQTVERFRPRYRYATVVSIDRTNRRCEVQYQGEPGTIWVNMGGVQPLIAGQVVRIDGLLGDRFISDVMGPIYEAAGRIICTSTTRPGTAVGDALGFPAPYDGMEIWETDTHKHLVWYDNYDLWLPPWNQPWGQVATASNAGGQTTASTTFVTVMAFSSTFSIYNDRNYDFHVHHNWRGSTGDNVIDYDVLVNYGTDVVLRTWREGNNVSTGANPSETIQGAATLWSGADIAGVYMWCRAARLTGTGTITMGSMVGWVNDTGPKNSYATGG